MFYPVVKEGSFTIGGELICWTRYLNGVVSAWVCGGWVKSYGSIAAFKRACREVVEMDKVLQNKDK